MHVPSSHGTDHCPLASGSTNATATPRRREWRAGGARAAASIT